MATNVDYRSLSPRQVPFQLVHTLRKQFNFNDAGISTGELIGPDALPAGAFITKVMVQITAAFNAGTTNTLTVGTNATNYNNIVSSADLTGNGGASISTQVTEVTRGYGTTAAASASTDLQVFVKYVQTGGAATTGAGVLVIEYEAGFST